MKLLVIVPTKGRHLQLKFLTYDWLKDSKIPFKILVEPQDYDNYALEGYNNLLLLPKNDQGINYSLKFGRDYAEQNGYDTIFKIDDDIKGWKQLQKNDKRSDMRKFLQIIQDIEIPLRNPNCGGISFGYRQEFWHDKKWFGINQKFQTCYVIKTELYHPAPPDMYEDYGNFMRVVDKGFKIPRYGRYVQDTRVMDGREGGLTEYYKNINPEKQKQAINMLKKEFPWATFKLKPGGLGIEPDMDNPVIAGKRL